MKPNILFLLYKSKINKDGKCPLKCRVTYQKKRKEFATGFLIEPKAWNSKKQEITPREINNYRSINIQLNLIKQELNQAYLNLYIKNVSFDVNDIVNKYKGNSISNEIGVLEIYNQFCSYLFKLIGKELNEETFKRYVTYGNHLKSFIKWKFGKNDIKLSDVRSSFINQYAYYLKAEKDFQQSTLNKIIQRFRRAIRFAVAEDYIMKDPFMLYKSKTVKKEIVFLSEEQLSNLENHNFKIKRIEQIRDMFVFCCYTGLAFKEMMSLRKNDVIIEFDGNQWIKIHRSKTSRSYKVPLLPKAKLIIDIYSNEDSSYLFPSMSNPKFNAYLKEIADIVGIKLNLTHHVARKTFATTVLLYNDVPIEIVSKLLGHSKIQTTQDHYGEIVQKKVSESIFQLIKKLDR